MKQWSWEEKLWGDRDGGTEKEHLFQLGMFVVGVELE
jgi:hypothetical protein